MERALAHSLRDLKARYAPTFDEDGNIMQPTPTPLSPANLRLPVAGGDVEDLRAHHKDEDLESVMLACIAAGPVDWAAAVRLERSPYP